MLTARLVLLVPVGHELANERSVSFTDTLGFDYVALNQGSSLLRRITDAAVSAQRCSFHTNRMSKNTKSTFNTASELRPASTPLAPQVCNRYPPARGVKA